MLRSSFLSVLTLASVLAAHGESPALHHGLPGPERHADVPVRVERQAYLMGTRVSMVTYDGSRTRGLARLESFLQVLEQAERELSTWRDDSVLTAFNRGPLDEPFGLSPALCRTFRDVWHLSASTGGRFDPAVGALLDAWGVQIGGRAATAADVQAALARSGLSKLAFDIDRCTLTRAVDVRLDAGAFGKGEALDRVAAVPDSGRHPWLVDLGGQLAVGGHPPRRDGWDIALAHPHRRGEAVLSLFLDGGSISTSGGSERDISAGGRRVSHIIDPRSGEPATYEGSVTVWHARALVADALSTALFLMGPDDGLAWADRNGTAACYLDADASGVKARPSRAFRLRFGTRAAGVPAP